MKSSSVSPMSKNIDIKQGLDVKNNLHDSGKAKFGKDFWYGKVKEKNCTCKPELHTSLHEVIEAEKTCPIHKEDSKCNCGKESLGVQEYCPTHNNPEDSKGECRCKEIGSGYKLLLDCPVHNSLESNGECRICGGSQGVHRYIKNGALCPNLYPPEHEDKCKHEYVTWYKPLDWGVCVGCRKRIEDRVSKEKIKNVIKSIEDKSGVYGILDDVKESLGLGD